MIFKEANVLIVVDSATQAAELQLLLENSGCTVWLARNGVEALEILQHRTPTVIVSDIVMPEMDGYQLCHQIKQSDKTKQIPVILVTALADPRDVVHGLACGADNFIVKPNDEHYLLPRIQYFLVNHELRAQEQVQTSFEVLLEGERHFITASRQQLLDLLISTYEQGVRINHELRTKHDELARSNSLLHSLFHFTIGITGQKKENELIDEALKRVLQFPDVAATWLLMPEKGKENCLVVAGHSGLDQLMQPLTEFDCINQCPCHHAVFRDKINQPTDITQCPLLKHCSHQQSHASIPLLIEGETIGVLNVVHVNGEAWSTDALDALASLGRQLSMALGRARLFDSLEMLVEERTKALANSESMLRNVLNNLPVAVLVADQDGELIISNQEFSQMADGVVIQSLDQFGQPLYIEQQSTSYCDPGRWLLHQTLQQQKACRNILLDIKTEQQDIQTLLSSAVPFFDRQHKLQGAIAVMQDMTEQRQQDLQMRIRTRAIEASINAIIITDNEAPDQPIVYVNPAFEQLTGYTSAEVLGKNCRLLQSQDRHQPGLDSIRRAIRNNCKGNAELLNYRKDGSSFWNDLTLAPVVNDRGHTSHFVGILRDITESKNYRQELEHQANYDSLTGLPNRNLLNDRLQQAIAYAKRHDQQFTLAFLDIDHFKVINDSLGHTAGDELLQHIAERMKRQIRDTDTIARLGGDEFVILLTDNSPISTHVRRLDKLRQQLIRPVMLEQQEIVISFSTGICRYPMDGDTSVTLLRNADTAMYEAKHQGRNRICMFKPEMNTIVQQRLQMEQAIRQGLFSKEFLVYYQPQADLSTGRLCGLEALVRWYHKEQMISPLAFISLAEQSGLITELDFYVFTTVCNQISQWRNELQGVSVAVNFSALSFMDAQFVPRIRTILELYQVDPDWIKIEMTESILMHDADESLLKMQELRSLGIHFSIDDFGTGYSSLAYLKRFPFGQLKIDRSFIGDVYTDPDSAALVRSMISMGHNLGIKVIAEGVETMEQLGFLLKAGCDEIQGYFYSMPLPADKCFHQLQHREQAQLPPELYANGQRCLLVVDSETNILQALKRELRLENYKLLLAESAAQAIDLLAKNNVDIVLTDLRLEDMTGIDFLQKVRAIYPDVIRMVLSATTEISGILKAINECVIYRFITKPWEPNDLKLQLAEAFRLRAIQLENEQMKQQLLANEKKRG
ncbi:PAS domain S-box/diguanylate cyclase (GGDEF) domain-containing protein [Rheinheimera sp. A13L]|uniref:EAL domain-containing protein n=1 Tax=Rheinheimera sp. A13L TaxID=506534 RepID=UPI000212493E|nr:EAL domain-containing protein [Rheinheimera sp. A13L]EGM76438.1 PAS domain S-box/diguanylate cyclase (GGDEF) domain-containing protein [Rheinheimera sp. A13L]